MALMIGNSPSLKIAHVTSEQSDKKFSLPGSTSALALSESYKQKSSDEGWQICQEFCEAPMRGLHLIYGAKLPSKPLWPSLSFMQTFPSAAASVPASPNPATPSSQALLPSSGA